MNTKREAPFQVVPRPAPAQPPPPEASEKPSLHDYLDIVLEERWTVLAALGIAVALAIAYVLLAAPVYRTDALLQVEDKKVGNSFLAELSGALTEQSPAEAEVEILRTRTMLRTVVRDLNLTVTGDPRRFPVIGGAIARRHVGDRVAGPFLGAAFAWGGERIRVDRLEVPAGMLGHPLTLVTGEGATYSVRDEDGEKLLDGRVGVVAEGNGIQVFLSELRSRPGLEFSIMRRHEDDVVAGLQKVIQISEKAKKSGIIQLTLEGQSPPNMAAILDALASAYVRQNVERRSAEAEKTLEFLQTQLPALRASLDAAEAELESYRSRRGSLDVTLETQAALTRAVEIEKALGEIRVEQAALRQRFTESHPAFIALDQKARRLESDRAAMESRMRKLPASELESARRMRDVKVANELYMAVLNKAQELRVVKEGTIGNVRILDSAAVPRRPVAPKKTAVLALAMILGLGFGLAIAVIRRTLSQGIEDPHELERGTSVPVTASVPHSEKHVEAERAARGRHAVPPLLAAEASKDLAVESLRSLRTSLQFSLVEAKNQIVAIGGPAPSVGKSFVSSNLAHLLGEAGKRVLVIDADMRRGQLHRHFGLERAPGLSEAIAGEVAVGEAIRPTSSPNVSILTTGPIPPNPSELLGSERFQRLLADVATRYDIVLVDTPPVLAVTDAALVAKLAGVTLLVVRAGRHPLREIQASLRQLTRNGVRVSGIVMNDVQLDRGLGRRSAYHYQYEYK